MLNNFQIALTAFFARVLPLITAMKVGYIAYLIYSIIRKAKNNKFKIWYKYLIALLLCVVPFVYYLIYFLNTPVIDNAIVKFINAYLIITAGFIISFILIIIQKKFFE